MLFVFRYFHNVKLGIPIKYRKYIASIPLSEQEKSFNNFTEDLELSKPTKEEQELLEQDLSVEEIKNVVHSFEQNKTPGEDRFTKEFYETFFDLLQQDLFNSYNDAFQKGSFLLSQRRGVIS